MMASIALALHALAAVVWVGGMAFAWGILRPVAGAVLSGRDRQRLWRGVFARFLPLVWVSVVVLLATGYYLLFAVFGGFAHSGVHIHIMHLFGLIMAAIFVFLWFGPWMRFRQAVDVDDAESGARELARIRRLVGINLLIGLVVVAVGAGGRFPW